MSTDSAPIIDVEFPSVVTVAQLTVQTGGGGGGGGVTDHGALTGLGDDDHSQYLTAARGDARYPALGHTHTALASVDITTLRLAIGNGQYVRLVPKAVDGRATLQFVLE